MPRATAGGVASVRLQHTSVYLEAFAHKTAAPAAPPAAAFWRPLGPFSIPHGQTYGKGARSRPGVSGRVSSVAIDPADPRHILIGAAGGGVWETRDEGVTWIPRSDDLPSLSIGAVTFDPTNPAIAYAGTGEGDALSHLGVGLLRSADGGVTWALQTTGQFAGEGFYDLSFDLDDAPRILAATTHGLYGSTDGGSTWTARRNHRTWCLSRHPRVSSAPGSLAEVFAACDDGLFRSTNGGATWQKVPLTGGGSYDRLEVCHAPSDGNVVYAFGASSAGQALLWRRATFGGPFVATTVPAGLDTGQAWYDWFAACAPNNHDVLYLGAIEIHKGVRTPTGAWQWEKISARVNGDCIHPDQHAIAFSPEDPAVVYIGNDGGVYRSRDAGVTWESLNKGLCITEFEYLTQHPEFDAWLLAGTQDNGTLRYEGEEVWYHVQDGDGGDCGTNNEAPYTCYHTFYEMGMERSSRGGGWNEWEWIGPDPPQSHESLFYPPLEVNGALVVQAGRSAYVSSDGGDTWRAIRLPVNSIASALAAPSTMRFYAGTEKGDIIRFDRSGSSWTTAILGRPRAGYVSDLLADPSNPSRLWASYSSIPGLHVFRTDDGGVTWVHAGAGLPSIPVNAIEVDPDHPDTIFAAADAGVFRSDDAGASWRPFGAGLPNALAKDLALHPVTRLLRVATQSRGVWEIPIDATTLPAVDIFVRDSVVDTGRRTPSPTGVANPFSKGTLTHWWQCTDIKLDAPPYQRPLVDDVDFELFEDDHGIFFGGLVHENPLRDRVARVYVQLHNLGRRLATNVAVRLFYTDAALGLPDLPPGFWTGFPNNQVPANSPWQPVGPHKRVASLSCARGEIIGFEWNVPPVVAAQTSLLAVITCEDDPLATTELDVAALVQFEKKCGLKSVAVVNPPPSVGPRLEAVRLNAWGDGTGQPFSFSADGHARRLVRGLVLSTALAKAARRAGIKSSRPRKAESAAAVRAVAASPQIAKRLDFSRIFAVTTGRPFLEHVEIGSHPEPVLILIEPSPRAGEWSLVQHDASGRVVGGFTVQAVKAPAAAERSPGRRRRR